MFDFGNTELQISVSDAGPKGGPGFAPVPDKASSQPAKDAKLRDNAEQREQEPRGKHGDGEGGSGDIVTVLPRA